MVERGVGPVPRESRLFATCDAERQTRNSR
jgi:hypothetical protein